MSYSYDRAKKIEKESIFELYRMVMGDYISEIWGWNEQWQINDFTINFNPKKIIVVHKNNILVAYSHIENENDKIHLRMLAVHPSYQGKGIGAKLVKSFVSIGKKQSKSLCLDVFKINIKAKCFYEKHGFSVISETDFSYKMGINTP
ncbi:MAG: GNAT family N-acetyltransferase [Epsilonproteobacteria bacterium]|nr:GNAT family N-acetyltransferase [Campylobacterota bacterium]